MATNQHLTHFSFSKAEFRLVVNILVVSSFIYSHHSLHFPFPKNRCPSSSRSDPIPTPQKFSNSRRRRHRCFLPSISVVRSFSYLLPRPLSLSYLSSYPTPPPAASMIHRFPISCSGDSFSIRLLLSFFLAGLL
ncbi:unnamed protein product [Citrullus colocynthis]|uniref:Uncharacterized protein n=1 Tax=Citrullus colocynthis TaxID=252529 RepID=A0ABP0YW87_9ROSI